MSRIVRVYAPARYCTPTAASTTVPVTPKRSPIAEGSIRKEVTSKHVMRKSEIAIRSR